MTQTQEAGGSDAVPPITVVGIGASAGGLTALQQLFAHVPDDAGVAFVVVVHLNPEHVSHLAELLQPHVRMPVLQVVDAAPLEPNRVYVIPPGANLSAIDSHLRVTRLEQDRRERAPIDHFFRTLAATHDGRSVGIILTGTGSDGALGIKEIKARDGLTVVQAPDEAEYDGMPQSAIATGAVDVVLPLREIPGAVLGYERTRPNITLPREDEGVETGQSQLLQKVFAQVRSRTGRDFTRYKPSTILRRIQRRMQLRQVEELPAYVDLLRRDADEIHDLADDLLINVTNFFRDAEAWEHIAAHVVPALFTDRSAQDTIRAWSVGCATGEEVYSMAMLLLEEAGRREAPPHIQIFASDLHERSIERAREGFYPGDIEVDVSSERLRRFFHREDGGYRVRKEVRELIVFAPHNLLADPPFSRLDLIACRNVLIYLQRDVQQDVLELFHYALRPGGFLLLGASETVDGSELYHTENKRHCIHRKRNVRAPEPRLPVFPVARPHLPVRPRAQEPPPEPIAYRTLHQQLIEQYAPPSMVIAPDGRIVHLSRHAGRYLVHPEGELTASVFKLLREELRIELRAALHSTHESGRPVRSSPVAVHFDGERRHVTIDVRQGSDAANAGFALVVFEEVGESELRAAPEQPAPDPAQGGRVRQLEAELDVARQRLQAIIEEYETTQEEMKASHEELQSANEELRSTLEELETSKEELQSMNEELQTVNQENRHKVEELAQLSSDLQNLLGSTQIATLFLDRELRILRFTPQVGELFNVRPVDRGRPLSDLTHRLGYPQLREDAEGVLRQLIPLEREVQDERGRWYMTRVAPYRDAQDRIQGVVVTFVEISERVRAEVALRKSEARFRTVANLVPDLLWSSEADGSARWYNDRWYDYTGQTPEQAAGLGWLSVVHPEQRAAALEGWQQAVAARSVFHREVQIRARDGAYRWFLVRSAPLADDAGGELQWLGAATDVHEQRVARDELEARVAARTAELAEANAELKAQISERLRVEESRRDILRQLVTAEEAERTRISRELHDSMSQLMTGLLLGLRGLDRRDAPAEQVARIEELERLADHIARELQHMAVELRPPALDTLGLAGGLQNLLDEWAQRHGVDADFHVRGLDDVRPAPESEFALYRVVQEALTNVLRHAGATHVSIVLERGRGVIRLILEDNGRGFDADDVLAGSPRSGRLGLLGMRERVALIGGELDVESSPGQGCTLFVRVPVESSMPAPDRPA